MNCVYENYLYIYNIKLMEENTLLIKKNFQKCFLFYLFCKTFLSTQQNMIFFYIFDNKNHFLEFSFQTQFFLLKTQKMCS